LTKKSYIYSVIFLLLLPLTIVNAISSKEKSAIIGSISENEKWVILDKYKKKQFDLLFESDLWNFSSEFNSVFDISKKVDIFENIWDKTKNKREDAEVKKEELIEKITSLNDSIAQLDIDIKDTLKNVDEINKNIIQTKKEIDINKKTIEILLKKISDNSEILLEYLIYIYKKWNTIYEKKEIDNLKSILLNEEDISDIINDLYFKWMIQVAWKKLIDNHRKYVTDLYYKKVKLDKQEVNLKKFRKMWIIEKKILSDKKEFKERILEESKWQQSFYEDFVNKKMKAEKKIQLRTFKEKVRFNTIRDNILKKYGCKFIDITKNTAEVRALAWKCLDINRMIYSESKLEKTYIDESNFFDWPVDPVKWISSYYKDTEYKKEFWSEHDAIDIVVDQGTSIRAPADWYVVYIEEPNSEDYAYVALKHHDWYITIYWHISSVLVEEFDYVKKWEVFAKTWWKYGTYWAWFLTSWPHLHFEIYKDKKYIDPFTALNLSYIQYTKLDEKYRQKFYKDFKERRWYEFKYKIDNSKSFKLEWTDEIERQKYLIKKYAVWSFNNWQMWIDESLDANIDPSFTMCIWLAETTLWKNLSTAYNIWNVWNNDRWDRKQLPDARSWIFAILHTLNNRYFWNINSIAKLSWAWRKKLDLPACWEPWAFCYATDVNNWHRNIVKCLSHLKWTYIPDDYNFRLIK